MERENNPTGANACALSSILVLEVLERIFKKREDEELLKKIAKLKKDFFFLSNEDFSDLFLKSPDFSQEEINKKAVFLLSGAASAFSLLEIVDNLLKEDLEELFGEVYACLELSSACVYGILEVLRGYLSLIEDEKVGIELREKMDGLAEKTTKITKQ